MIVIRLLSFSYDNVLDYTVYFCKGNYSSDKYPFVRFNFNKKLFLILHLLVEIMLNNVKIIISTIIHINNSDKSTFH